MRVMLVLAAALAGCSGGPPPGPSPVVQMPQLAPDDAVVGVPGIPSGNSVFSPTTAPTTEGGRYYGYN